MRALLLLLASLASAAEPPAYHLVSQEGKKRAGLLGSILSLESRREEYLNSRERDSYLQHLGVLQSFAGEYDAALARFAELRPVRSDDDFSGVEAVPALDEIVARARERRAVFINEAHHVPRHRVLTYELLRRLKPLGYRYFAAETLSAEDAELALRGYPRLDMSGYYTNEPIFAELVREALRLGYTVVPYEHDTECAPSSDEPWRCQNERELGQARNLFERVFRKDPQARVLVHAGYSHINENGDGAVEPSTTTLEGRSWVTMARYFRRLTGLDPLTVDQVRYMSASAPKTLRIRQPSVLRRKDGIWLGPPMYDLVVLHPAERVRRGRPDWVRLDARVLIAAPLKACRDVRPCLIRAFYASEDQWAVPADQVLVRDGAAPALALRPGGYRIEPLGPDGALESSVLRVGD